MSAQPATTSAASKRDCDFDAVYAEHFDFVWRNLRRAGVGDPQLRDAAQEVFLVVHRRLADFVPDGDGSLRSWLYSIVRRVASAQYRQSRGRHAVDSADADDFPDDDGLSPERQASRAQALRLLLDLLEELDADKRDALVLVDLEGMSVPEACSALDANVNTVYSRLRAARQQMRAGIGRRQLEDWRTP